MMKSLITIAALFVSGILALAQEIIVKPERDSGIYSAGEKIQWSVQVKGDAAGVKDARYLVKTGGLATVQQGALEVAQGKASVEASLDRPGWLVLEVNASGTNGKKIAALGGAIVSPEKLKPALPMPEDFDAFWAGKLKELARVPANPVLTPGDSGNPKVIYQTVVMDNIRGTHIRGQIARPAKQGKFPAVLTVQWAGVYPLEKGWVTDNAANGWLALDIEAHDIPIAEPKAFYKELEQGSLKDYPCIGREDREACYFLRMYLSCYRAAEYLCSRDDWDGKTLVVNGGSQGGQQTLITAALHPKVTAALANIPAGCDSDAPDDGRLPSFPWMSMKTDDPDAAARIKQTGRYFDVANFAPRIKCPVLVGMGGIDQVCPPSGIYAALNRMTCPKEIVYMPTVGHPGPHDAYFSRFKEWMDCLRTQGGISPKALNSNSKKVPTADDRLKSCERAYADANQAWSRKEWSAVRSALAPIVADPAVPIQWRSIAHLRSARSYLAEGKTEEASKAFETIAAIKEYPQVHRTEAAECRREAELAAKGLPPRNPEESRVRVPPAPKPGRVLHVSPTGKDSNEGTANEPFATIAKALESARAKGAAPGGTVIELASGTYSISKSISLTKADTSAVDAPLVIRAEKPGSAVLYGGVRLTGFQTVTDPAVLKRLPEEGRGKVVQCDLKALGIADFGKLAVRGYGQPPAPPTVELYVNGKPQTLARWPNEGFVKAAGLVEPGNRNAGKPSVLAYSDERHARWAKAEDPWLFGYFRYLYADASIRVASIDPKAKTMTTSEAYVLEGVPMDAKQGIVYYAFNLLEELDRPGEWYLDRTKGVLYWYPTTDPAKAAIELSLLPETMLRAQDVSHLRLEGLVFDCARFNGVELKNCSDCIVAGCTIQRMAGNGISIDGGHRDWLVSCDLNTLGRRASEVIGGDRPTLTPGGHVVANCRFQNFSRIDRTYTPAIQLEGVGNRVAHNLFLDCPSSAMRVEGNDHLIEYNEFRDVLQESDDQGAIDMWNNPTYRGVVFRYNLFQNIGNHAAAARVQGQGSIRFDDIICGMLVYGNIFYKGGTGFGAVQMNCGRDNIIDNNLFLDCPVAVSGGFGDWNSFWKEGPSAKPRPGFITSDLYKARYPELTKLFSSPQLNYLWRNAIIRCEADIKWNPATYDRIAKEIRKEDPGFLKGADLNRPVEPSLFTSMGLRPIPVDEIGLYPDPMRRGWIKPQ